MARRLDLRALAGRARRSRLLMQSVLFGAASALTSVVAGLAQILLARELSSAEFGSLAFATSFLLFVALFFDFGLYLPAAREAAHAEGDAKREIIGASLLLYVPIGLSFAALTFGLSFVVDDVFNVDAGEPLRAASLLAVAYPFVQPAINLCQGMDRLHIASVSSAAGQSGFLLVLLALVAAGVALTATSALLLRTAGYLLTLVMVVVWLRPLFRRAGEHIRTLIAETRRWGFHVYTGRVLSVGTYNMDVIMLGAFVSASTVGYYTLAGSLANFLGWPVAGLSTALFARMTTEDRIDRRWLTLSWAIGVVAVVGMFLLGPFVVELLFTDRYAEVASLAVVLMMAQAVRGATSVYNSFLSAHARGKELRNAGVVLTISNLVLNLALIPPFGALGAAWASFLALVANYAAHVVSYRRALKAPTPTPA